MKDAEDIRAPRGHVARYGKGALRRRSPVVRQDTAQPVAPNEPVQGGWQSPVKEDRR